MFLVGLRSGDTGIVVTLTLTNRLAVSASYDGCLGSGFRV